jgi:hypothetical protein
MLDRMLAALLLSVALGGAAVTAAHAQNVADADHTMRAMDLRMRALNAARKNLQQIEPQDHDANAAREISDADVRVFAEAVKVYTVAFFLKGMQCPADVRFAQKQFGLVVSGFVTTAEAELARVNDNLAHIAAPAAVAEATHIRDVMLDLHDFLKPFAVPE